ncbi:MAG: hypothetical protein PHQ14_10950 [Chromatiales bacterium]|jgi:hypothetical protein|nr:hypothetical protein [Chromatiales bacterium]MDX9767184.1 hypothetical protein [Ectothiorhodospiraceae bacterium]
MSLRDLFRGGSGEYRVHYRNIGRRRALGLLLIIGLAFSTWWVYELGISHSGLRNQYLADETKRLTRELEIVREASERLMQRNAVLERSAEIERESAEQVRASLQEMEVQMLELNEELSFYRSLVVPGTDQRGLNLQNVTIEPTDRPREYAYRLVLTQVHAGNRTTSGEVELVVEGRQDGAIKRLTLAELGGGARALRFSFRYFQTLEGQVSLPEGFRPAKLHVRAKTGDGKLEPVERTYTWDAITSGGNT